jgi:hypothetical protein
MKKLILIKGKSYTGFGVSVSEKNPVIEVDEKKATTLLNTGYFKIYTPTQKGEEVLKSLPQTSVFVNVETDKIEKTEEDVSAGIDEDMGEITAENLSVNIPETGENTSEEKTKTAKKSK